MASLAALTGLATAARGSNGVSVAEARRHLQQMESFRQELPHEHEAPAPASGSGKEEETAGQLSLGDFMNLAYTLSTMYKRVHPERKATSGEARRVKYYQENAVLGVLVVFIFAALSFGVFLLADRVTCRPMSMDPATFANSTVNYYAMTYIDSVCETEIKVRQHGGYTVLAVLLVILGLALVGINKVCLDKLNRLHAIARGDIYSEVMRGEPVRDDETTEMFARFTIKFYIVKSIITFAAVGGFSFFIYDVEMTSHVTEDERGTFVGGSIVSKYGTVCDGRYIRFEDNFSERYRCHLMHEAAMEYLKAFVYLTGGVMMLTLLAMLGTLGAFFYDYLDWRRRLEAARQAPTSSSIDAGKMLDAQAVDPSLVRSLRVLIRLAMGFFAAEPPEGMPDLLAKVIIGKPPSRDELAGMVGRLLSLDKPLPEEVSDVLYAVLQASMGRGVGDPGDFKELLLAAIMAYGDAERQQYMRGMLDVLRHQNRAKRQTGGIGPAAGATPTRRVGLGMEGGVGAGGSASDAEEQPHLHAEQGPDYASGLRRR